VSRSTVAINVVGDADDVAGPGIFVEVALAR